MTLRIPDTILCQMIAMADHTENELIAMVRIKDNEVVDIRPLDQLSEMAYCKMEADAISKFTMERHLAGEDVSEWCGIFHTHPEGMGSGASITHKNMLMEQCGDVHGYSIILSSPDKEMSELDIQFSYIVSTRNGLLTKLDIPCTIVFTGSRSETFSSLVASGIDQWECAKFIAKCMRTDDTLSEHINSMKHMLANIKITKGIAAPIRYATYNNVSYKNTNFGKPKINTHNEEDVYDLYSWGEQSQSDKEYYDEVYGVIGDEVNDKIMSSIADAEFSGDLCEIQYIDEAGKTVSMFGYVHNYNEERDDVDIRLSARHTHLELKNIHIDDIISFNSMTTKTTNL